MSVYLLVGGTQPYMRGTQKRNARGTPGHAAMRLALVTVDFGLSGTIFPKLSVPKLYLMESMHSK